MKDPNIQKSPSKCANDILMDVHTLGFLSGQRETEFENTVLKCAKYKKVKLQPCFIVMQLKM